MVEPLDPRRRLVRRRCSGPSTSTASSSPGRASTTRGSTASSGTASRSSSRARCPGSTAPSVDVDNVAGAAAGGRAPDRASGHRRIACITNAPLAYTAAQRAARRLPRGARGGRASRSTRTSSPTAAFDAGERPPGRWPSCSRAGPIRRPSFVASDVVAFGAIAAIREAGLRVPDDVSVVGFDDIALAAFFDPPLTTVRLPAYDLGPRGRHVPCSIGSPAGRSPDGPAADRAHRPRSSTAPADRRARKHRRTRPLIRARPVVGGPGGDGPRQDRGPGKETRMQQCDNSMASRRAGSRLGSGGARASPPAARAADSSGRSQVGHGRSAPWGGDEREDLPGDGRAVGDGDRATRSSTPGTRDINAVLTTGVASGNLPDLAGLPGPGQMSEFAEAGALKPLDDVLDVADVQGRDRAGPRRARHRRRQARRRVHQGRGQGPDLVQPEAPRLRGRAARRAGTTSRPGHCQQGQRRGDLVHRARVRRRVRLAGHRLDRGHRPAPGRPGRLRPVVRGQAEVDRSRDQDRVRDVRQGRRQDAYGGSRPSIDDQLRRRRRPAVHDPSGLRVPPPGQLHHRPRRFKTRQGRHRLQLLPVPGHRPAVHRRGRRRRRPVRHVPGHARRPRP